MKKNTSFRHALLSALFVFVCLASVGAASAQQEEPVYDNGWAVAICQRWNNVQRQANENECYLAYIAIRHIPLGADDLVEFASCMKRPVNPAACLAAAGLGKFWESLTARSQSDTWMDNCQQRVHARAKEFFDTCYAELSDCNGRDQP